MSTDIDTAATHADPHAADGGSHDEHHVSDKHYVFIAIFLAVLTALEVAATEIGLGSLLVPLLLVMMTVKFFTVVLYFMHLKQDSKVFSAMFYLGLAFAVTLYSVVLATFHFFF